MPDFSDFVTAARDSLVAAQPETDPAAPPLMAVSEARLDLKVAVESKGGDLSLQTIPLTDITSGAVESSALSTVRLDFVALATEPVAVAPEKTPSDAIEEVASRPDLVALDKIFGGLDYTAEFVGAQGKWLIVASAGDLVVREAIVEDRG